MARQRSNRGGSRLPANPAPVSGPGALSQRTDGGPGQPIRVAGGQPYGARQEMERLQAAAPMAQASGAPQPAGGGGAGGAPLPSVFRPSDRPWEPVTSGAAVGQGPGAVSGALPDDPVAVLQAMFRRFQHPQIARLLAQMTQPGARGG